MQFNIGLPDFKSLADGIEGSIAQAATAAMRETTPIAKQELRDQVTSAGLGQRLANTWRGEVYPTGRRSITPAGYIWSNAPDIIDSFMRGAIIRPVNGAQFLWIPTKNVPLARGRVGRKGNNLKGGSLTPEECENRFNTDFIVLRGRAGRLLAFMDLLAAKNRRGFRPATRARLAQGRERRLTLMFILSPTARMPKVLDVDGVAQRWTDRFERSFSSQAEA